MYTTKFCCGLWSKCGVSLVINFELNLIELRGTVHEISHFSFCRLDLASQSRYAPSVNTPTLPLAYLQHATKIRYKLKGVHVVSGWACSAAVGSRQQKQYPVQP